jgi:hypothetical protein
MSEAIIMIWTPRSLRALKENNPNKMIATWTAVTRKVIT